MPNVWKVGTIRENRLWIQDNRAWKNEVQIYYKYPNKIGKGSGIKGCRALTIKQAENIITQLQEAVDKAKEVEALPPEHLEAYNSMILRQRERAKGQQNQKVELAKGARA